MQLRLAPAHRLARVNYPARALFFAYAFLVVLALFEEGRFGGRALLFAVLTFLVYPHLAYLHARIAVNSKRAELNNLAVDSALMGIWMAEAQFGLWPTCGALLAISLNNATCGVRRFVIGLQWFTAGGALWGAALGFPFRPETSPLVTGLCFFGVLAYASALGFIMHYQNRKLVRTRNVLTKSEEQFRFIAEHAGDLVAVVDRDGRIRYASESHRQLFGSESCEEGSDWLELVDAADRTRIGAFIDRLSASFRGEGIQLRMTTAAGARRVMDCRANPVHAGGNGPLVVIACRDLTARARAEIDIKLAERALDRMREPALVSDGSGRIEFVNAAFTELMGYTSREAAGRMTEELLSGEDPENAFPAVRRSLERDGLWRGRVIAHTASRGHVRLSARVSAIRDRERIASHCIWIFEHSPAAHGARAA